MDIIDNLSAVNDSELVSQARDGDRRAFDELFGRYQESIRQMYLQRTGGNEPDSNDMLQNTFIKVYLNLDRYNPEYTFCQWIFTIARNTFIDYTRRKREFMVSIDASDNFSNVCMPASQQPTPEERMIITQHSRELNTILDNMAPRYRDVIILRFFNEYSYDEIAEKLNVPIGTVKTLIHRAREILLSKISSKNGQLF
ncbi:MAG: sigma-70 family RNA polymerase sigma factor [Rikenellaceae bacterium]|jgi:RNA polymerase sigma-70 factor (ECF subfamily)|nr:sigma-70 family RNA polymerase sigma factor [Rikenellaceae bacterium]MBO5874106.1 sigma-70 family RNA polymerase sigma factor [Rikenellaceae bacterium]